MTWEKVVFFVGQNRGKFPPDRMNVLLQWLNGLPDCADVELFSAPLKNPNSILLFSIFLGGLGVDRFVVGDTALGVCKLLFNWLTLGIWSFVDIFCSYRRAKSKNLETLTQICLKYRGFA